MITSKLPELTQCELTEALELTQAQDIVLGYTPRTSLDVNQILRAMVRKAERLGMPVVESLSRSDAY